MLVRTVRNALVLSQLALLAALPLSAQHLPKAEPETVGLSAQGLRGVTEMLQGYVDRGEVAGAVALVARDGKVVLTSAAGVLSTDTKQPMTTDAIFRIASMTKPVTSIAIMMLVEEGKVALSDPVSKFIPEFASMQVAVRDAEQPNGFRLEPARQQITIENLLTHRSGLTYGFLDRGPVGNLYRENGVADGVGGATHDLAENVRRIARQPLVNQPGTNWQYGVSTDVLGRVVEVASGMPLDRFFRTRIFDPLGMHDTDFAVAPEKLSRVAAVHATQGGIRVIEDPTNAAAGRPPLFSGGGGLYSTAEDYAVFAQMLLNKGEINGVRLVRASTIDQMTTSHTSDITGNIGIVGAGRDFGLGFAITRPDGSPRQGTAGTFDWFGIYGTNFWVDPAENMIAVGLIQLSPNTAGSFRDAMRSTVYQALTAPRATR